MKGMIDIPLMGAMFTIAISLSIIVPPAIIKTTMDKETVFTYDFEKTQHILLTILSNKKMYEDIGMKSLINKPEKIDSIKTLLDSQLGSNNCLMMIRPRESSVSPTSYFVFTGHGEVQAMYETQKILLGNCNALETSSNTLIVTPYNKGNLVETIKVGKK